MPATPDRGYAARPVIVPLGDAAALVRFSDSLTDSANRAALDLAAGLARRPIAGVVEIVPNLVSVLVRYDPAAIGFTRLAGEIGLVVSGPPAGAGREPRRHRIATRYDGPDLGALAEALGLGADAFVEAHQAAELRVLATGFAPGFVYCGFHDAALAVPRRRAVRPAVRPGTVLFAAGQTALAATEIPTGWHVVGHTDFVNFDPAAQPPTRLAAGDFVRFEAAR